jgi:hypothetical protein
MYDGMTDPTKFIEFFRIQACIHSWDDTAQIANVIIFLKDKGLSTFNELTTKTTMNQVYAELRLKCSPRPETLMHEFNTRKLGKGESITKFGTELSKLLKGASPDLTAAQALIQIKSHLKTSLPASSGINLLLQVHKDKTLSELLSELDDAIPNTSSTGTSGDCAQQWDDKPTPAVKTEPSETNYTNSNIQNQSGRSGQQNISSKFPGNCNYCGLYGHRFANCLKRQREQGPNQNYSQQYNQRQFQNNPRPPAFVNSNQSYPSQSYTPQNNTRHPPNQHANNSPRRHFQINRNNPITTN